MDLAQRLRLDAAEFRAHGRELTADMFVEAASSIERLQQDNARMSDLLHRRPAMNAGLVEAYVKWTALVYASDIAHAASPDGLPPKLVEH